jgi:hypothetical protein
MPKKSIFLKQMAKKCCLLLMSLFFVFGSFAQDSKGTEFWICFPGNLSMETTELYITSETNSTVTIDIAGIGFNEVVNVTAGALQVVTLPNTAQVQSEFVAENKGIHITATAAITVYGMNAAIATTDAFLAFPVDALGTEHYVLGYTRDFSFVIPVQATIVASQNNTIVTITSTLSGGGFVAGVPTNILLQQGQVYQLRNSSFNADYTGTKIVSDKPIAVYGGSQLSNISGTFRAGDHLVEQLPPTNSWGRSFITIPLALRTNGDVFRFLAQANGTAVSVNGTVVANLNAGQFFETILGSNTYNRITSNFPILVGQYSRSSQADNVVSDPFFALVPPDEQFLNNYVVSAGTSNIPTNFINITSPTSNISNVRVDNVVVAAGLWSAIAGTSFSGAAVPVSNGVHSVTSPLPIGTLVYGYGSFDSYGYLGGQSFSPVATVTSVTLTPETANNTVGNSQCLTANVRDQFGVAVPGVRVDFDIVGPNATLSGFANTNSGGVAQYCYTGAAAGTDAVRARVGGIGDDSRITWANQPPVVSSVVLSPKTGISQINISQCFTATVKDQFGNNMSGVTVSFTITGTNANAGTASTNASGVATYCYTGTAAGTDNTLCAAGGISDNGSFIWTAPSNNLCNIRLSTTSERPDCSGNSTGSIDLTVTGGTAPYTYRWSNGATTQDIANVPSGYYDVTVKDANNCKAWICRWIANTPTLKHKLTVTPNPTVEGQATHTIFTGYGPQAVTLQASATGGTGTISFDWGALGNNPEQVVSPAATTDYFCTITDSKGCTRKAGITIKVKDVRCGTAKDKIQVCTKNGIYNELKCVPPSEVPALLSAGGKLGWCQTTLPPPPPPQPKSSITRQLQLAEGEIQLFPNPTGGMLNVRWNIGASAGDVVINVINAKGIVAMSFKSANNQIKKMDLSQLSNGLYVLQVISTEKKVLSAKFLVNK